MRTSQLLSKRKEPTRQTAMALRKGVTPMNCPPYEGSGWYSQSGYIAPAEKAVKEFLSYEEYREWLAELDRES